MPLPDVRGYSAGARLSQPLLVPLELTGRRRRDQRHAHEPGIFAPHHVATAADLRRSGRDRDRERAAVQRDQGGAGAADRDGRHPEGDRQFAVGRAAGVRRHRPQRQPADRRLSTAVHRLIDDIDHLVAFTPTNPEADAALQASFPTARSRPASHASAVAERKSSHITILVEAADEFPEARPAARLSQHAVSSRCCAKATSIGIDRSRGSKPGPFADHHVQLLQTFADQAVIAIENVAAVRRGQARTATGPNSRPRPSEVLEVISSLAGDARARVPDAMLENALPCLRARISASCIY